jgi:hypothetical protein
MISRLPILDPLLSSSLGSQAAYELARASSLTKRANIVAWLVTNLSQDEPSRVELQASRASSRVSGLRSSPTNHINSHHKDKKIIVKLVVRDCKVWILICVHNLWFWKEEVLNFLNYLGDVKPHGGVMLAWFMWLVRTNCSIIGTVWWALHILHFIYVRLNLVTVKLFRLYFSLLYCWRLLALLLWETQVCTWPQCLFRWGDGYTTSESLTSPKTW